MRNIVLFTVILCGLVWGGCVKEDRLDHIDSSAPAPAQITQVNATPTPGGVVITYKIPADSNLSYVKAVYEIQQGVVREAKSSRYTDTLTLVGFGDTSAHQVKLYSVGKNEKASEPLTIMVKPDTPPVMSVFQTLNLDATFGGVSVDFINASNANISILVIVDTTGKDAWAPVTTFYTGAAAGRFAARGFSSEERRFGVFVRDRWNNKSDTLIKRLTPRFETEIPKALWKALHLPGDTWEPTDPAYYSLERLWDGKWAKYNGEGFASKQDSKLPSWFTIDLGQKVLLSRFREHQANATHLYDQSAVKSFELWGSNSPDPDGGWNNWQLLGKFDSFKPSGLPRGQITAEDKNYANFLGEEFIFDTPPPAVRYLRWKTLETYSSAGQIVMNELDFYGQPQ